MATPSRRTRAQVVKGTSQDLPEALTRDDINYGATGRPVLTGQLEQNLSNMSSSMANHRHRHQTAAHAPTDPDSESAQETPRKRAPRAPLGSMAENKGPDNDRARAASVRPQSEHGTAIEEEIGVGYDLDTGARNNNAKRIRRPRSSPAESDRESRIRDVARPWDFSILYNNSFFRMLWHFIKPLNTNIFRAVILLTVATSIYHMTCPGHIPYAYEVTTTRLLPFARALLRRETTHIPHAPAESNTAFINYTQGIIQAPDVRPTGKSVAQIREKLVAKNMLTALENQNFFDPRNGARIDHSMTSPTAVVHQSNWLKQMYVQWRYPARGPTNALLSWESISDCWCATQSTEPGRAQLGVITRSKVSPLEFIVEHVIEASAVDITTAPQQLELWMQMDSTKRAEEVSGIIKRRSPNVEWLGECGEAPGRDWICVSRGVYNPQLVNWVQHFPAYLDTRLHDIASNHFVVRATSNWGGAQTCLYRVRLHGEVNAKA